jgi:predicted small integral membrane protein
MILVGIFVIYYIIALYFLITWSGLFKSRSKEFSSEKHLNFIDIDIVMAALLWPIVFPIIDIHLIEQDHFF